MAGHRTGNGRSRPAGRMPGMLLGAALVGSGPALAQDAAPGLRLDLTPYLWIAGVSGTLRTPSSRTKPYSARAFAQITG